METPIKPGKYKMRNGKQAIVVGCAPVGVKVDYPITGWRFTNDTWHHTAWSENGIFVVTLGDSDADLISPWIDAPVFNHWDKIPGAKAVYLTQDKRWVACSHVPKYFDAGTPHGMSFWSISEPVEYAWSVGILKCHAPVWEGPPKDSLIIRPESV